MSGMTIPLSGLGVIPIYVCYPSKIINSSHTPSLYSQKYLGLKNKLYIHPT